MTNRFTMRSRNLAIVLLDIIGSTAFVQRFGAVKAAKWFQYHDRLARNLVYKFEGREIDRSDGFLLSFESVLDAVNFALHYQRTVPQKTKLQTRIGVHWGSVVEVAQDELWVGVGAKSVELEGLAKNIAARTMSLCGPGQVLLTRAAIDSVRGRTNMFTPRGTKYACVGMYRFKGVKDPLEIHAVGTDIAALQPPPGNDKVKRLGGPKYIKLRARDREIKDWLLWVYKRIAVVSALWVTYVLLALLSTPVGRDVLDIQEWEWLGELLRAIIDACNGLVVWR